MPTTKSLPKNLAKLGPVGRSCALIATALALASIVGCAAPPDEGASASSEDAISTTQVSWCSLLVQGYPQFQQYPSYDECRDNCLSGGCVTTRTRDAIWAELDAERAASKKAAADEQAESQRGSAGSSGAGGTSVRSCNYHRDCRDIEYCIDHRCEL